MNILFIYSLYDADSPEKPMYTPEYIQFGISYISALLKKHGHQTKLLVLSRLFGNKNTEIIDAVIHEFQPKLICFTAVSTEYNFISSLAKYIKGRYGNIYLLVGGPHASLNPHDVINDDFDAVCVGEGEYPTLELVLQLKKGKILTKIPNLWIKHSTEVEMNATRPFIQDLDNLPFPDREMWKEWIDEQPGSRYAVLLGRGCPFQCTYCCNHALKKLAKGPYVRYRSPENIIKEIEDIAIASPKTRELYLEIETIGANKKWAMDLCAQLKNLNATFEQPFTFGVNIRIMPNVDYDELFATLKESNFKSINIGLESGSERIRREILKRNYSNRDIISAVNLARKYGLKVSFYNMLGFPTETLADFMETIKINRTCMPDYHNTSIFFPYPGTSLYALCKEHGLLKKPLDVDMERNRAVLDLKSFTKKQVQKKYVWFDYYIYKGRKPMYKILMRIFVLKLRSISLVGHFYNRLKRSFMYKWMRNKLRDK
ncbi:MAG: B12-binding domain-containing radical SAM protein [Candidatus Margulisbacteria bacterium]|nr:B12-binding domain-containing radical SAM protein [Candidatus Margulisiibacteriota bacterium]MBU1022122.1 B12-binding domain-containing radical SAM protein [Candidatus Margulisiibacteriota bacterium]MBU1728638.1 B12-binding domain-containing radical SAM protein [Candidatus Margulisiibacteriota bacterium]MBU1955089.1 B12-binding domain-containing radical SAM protein [Candidatus Margulisiibacteriota bacterium]